MRVKPEIKQQPVWDERFIGWAAKFIANNKWRCDPTDEFDDHMGDAYITFRYILASYPLITEPSQIMALFQTAMINEYHDRAKKWTRKRTAETSFEVIIGEDLKLIDSLGEENNEGLLKIVLSELPPEVRAVLDVLNDEEKLKLLRQPKTQSLLARWMGIQPTKESLNTLKGLNEALCRLMGLPKNTDLLNRLKSALLK